MAKLILLVVLAYTAYVCADPPKKDVRKYSRLIRVSRAAYPHHNSDYHDHEHDHEVHYDHSHDHGHQHDSHDHGHQHDSHDHGVYGHDSHDHGHQHDSHDHGHQHDSHDHEVHYDHSHDHGHQHDSHDHGHQHDSHDHGVYGHDSHGHGHQHDSHDHGVYQYHPQGHSIHPHNVHQKPGYDEIYVYIDVPETYSNNSQASVIEAALIEVEDDANLRGVLSDLINSELQDEKTPNYRYPQVIIDKKSQPDPDSTLSPEFIRRK